MKEWQKKREGQFTYDTATPDLLNGKAQQNVPKLREGKVFTVMSISKTFGDENPYYFSITSLA